VVLAIAVCLFIGFCGWVYQGYIEDSGSEPMQSWPFGVGGYLAGGVLTLVAIRRARPTVTDRQLGLVAVALAAGLIAAAVGALDAGNG
jgi:hypothetical protein